MWKIKEMKTQIHMTIMSSLKLYYAKYLKANKYFFLFPWARISEICVFKHSPVLSCVLCIYQAVVSSVHLSLFMV